jgi:hypothetical protein
MNVLENIGGIHAMTVPQTGLTFHRVSDNLLDDIFWMSHSSVFQLLLEYWFMNCKTHVKTDVENCIQGYTVFQCNIPRPRYNKPTAYN